MAVQPSTGRSVPLYVLIIFVVLFLISTTGLVLLFVHQEDLKLQATQATELFQQYIGTRLKNSGKLEAYKAMGESARPKQTAVEALLADRDRLAQIVAGNSAATSKDVMEQVNELVKELPAGTPASIKQVAQNDLKGALQQAVTVINTQAQQIETLKDQLRDLQSKNRTITAGYQKLEKKFQANVAKFLSQLKNLQRLVDSYKKQYTEQLKRIKSQVSKELKVQLTQMEKQFDSNIDDLRDIIKRNLTLLIASTRELGPVQMRVSSGITVDDLTQRIDGQILDISDDVVYIDLGKQHGIKKGIRFVVISTLDKGRIEPPVKAIIEVTDVGDMTSECRIVSSSLKNPILKGDLLINLIYDRELKLKIFVLGEFDWNEDGILDSTGRLKVETVIARSGGIIMKQLSPDVNFVVLGVAGEEPTKPGPGAGADALKAYKHKLQRYRQYNDLKEQIQALNIPVITPKLIKKYTGYETDRF